MRLAAKLVKHNPKIFRSSHALLVFESIEWAIENEGGKVSIVGIAKHLGISDRTVKKIISIFKMMGIITVNSIRNRVNCYSITPDSEIDIRFLPDESIKRIEKSYKTAQQVKGRSPCNNTKNKEKPNPIYNKQVIEDYAEYCEGPGPFWDYQESDFVIDQSPEDKFVVPDSEIASPESIEFPRIEKSRKEAISDCLLTEAGVKAGFNESHVIQLCQWRFTECSDEYLTLTIKYFLEDLSHPLCKIVDPIRYLFRVLGRRSVYVSQVWKWEADERKRAEKEQSEREWQEYWAAEREKDRIRAEEREKVPREVREREAEEHVRRQQEGFTEILRMARMAAGAA